ncbi:MAG: DUF2382 domain-containing protein [Actinobacteria bacterium]|nr:DUF2382 domain-containing protein [Actinomycetota bacterium]
MGARILYVRRYSVARENRSDRFAKDEDRKRSEEGLRAGSSRGRQRDRHDDHSDRHHDDNHESLRVPKKREEAHVERIPVEEGQAPEDIEVRDDEVLIPVTEEETVVEKREVVKEVLRVRKDVVEDEEVVGVDAHEKDEHRDLDERARRGLSGRDRRGATDHEEEGGRGERNRGERERGDDTSFIDKAKEALSGEDTRGREESRTRREDEPTRRRWSKR